MDTLQYWPFAHEYSIWNAAVTALQFWTVDFKPHILSNAIDQVYAAFFYSDYTEDMAPARRNTPVASWPPWMMLLQLSLYRRMKDIRVGVKASMSPHLSAEPFNPANFGWSPTTPEQHAESSPHRYRDHSITCHQLVFTSSEDESPVWPNKCHSQHSSTDDRSCDPREADASSSVHHSLCYPVRPTPTANPFFTNAWDNDTTSSKDNFPTAPFNDDVWYEDPIPDRYLCIHETPDEPHHQCSYPCPYQSATFRMDLPQSTSQNEAVFYYDSMDFSDISSDLPDIMMTTSDNDIPNLVDVLDAVWFA